MKRIALFFTIALAAISCATEEVVTPVINVVTEASELVHSPAEGMIPVEFNVNVDWTAYIKESEAREWCAISPSKGGKAGDNVLNVICIENKGTDNRTATVVIKAMDIIQELVVTQLQKDVLVLTAEREYDIPYQGQELTFKVSHNLDLKVKSDADWITRVESKSLTEETITFAVAPNSGEAREGKITFTAEPFEEEIVVRQAPWVLEFTVDPAENKVFDPAGGEYKMTVASNVEYYVTLANNDWLKMDANGDEYTFTAQPNGDLKARETEVRISPKSAKYVSASKVIIMSQKGAGAKIDISELEKSLTCMAQSFDLTVDATIEYDMYYKTSVDGEYVDIPADEKWLSHTVSGNVYTFTATMNDAWTERSLILYFVPKDAAYVDMITSVVVRQYGHAFQMWCKRITDLEGYDPTQKVRLAVYKEKLLVANTDKVYILNPVTGEVEATVPMPSGVKAHSVLVDDAGNLLVAADGHAESVKEDTDGDGTEEDVLKGEEMTLYYIADPMNPELSPVLTYHTASYYGVEVGNFRVKGNIKDDAVITAVIADGAGGAVLIWDVVDGVVKEELVGETMRSWHWTNVPYTAWNVASLCCYPVGESSTDGLFYIGYGGDYNLYYASSIVKDPAKDEEGNLIELTEWTISYETASTWMENYNCISTTEWKGSRYAAILMGCHFNYDDTDIILLDVTDPSAAEMVYTYVGTSDVERTEDWTNLWWNYSDVQTPYHYSDVLLIPTEDVLLVIGADSAYGTLTCSALMK